MKMLLTVTLQNIAMFFSGLLGGFYLQKIESISAVLASAIIGLIATFFPWEKLKIKNRPAAVIYCGSFAAMCTPYYLSSLGQVFVLSLIGGGVVSLFAKILNGHGGKLGSMGYVSVIVFVFLGRLL